MINGSRGGYGLGKGMVNTAATNILNDQVTLVADGVSRWYAVAQLGVWKAEA